MKAKLPVFFRNRKYQKIALPATAFLVLLYGGICLYYAIYIEPAKLILKQVDIHLPQWHKSWHGLRILLISDIHAGKYQDHERLEKIIRLVESRSADLILLLGDYGAGYNKLDSMPPEDIGHFLARLKARYGVYAILGNHDWVYNPILFRQALTDAGIPILENESCLVSCGERGVLELCGLPDYGTREHWFINKKIVKRKNAELPSLAMTHNPLPFILYPDQMPYDLTVSGHTHGGQVSLPLLGPVKLPLEYRIAGLVKGLKKSRDGRQIYITSGLGNTLWNMRFGNVPEIVELVICTGTQ